MDILIYLAKASALVILFYLVYVVLLKRDTYHNFKRGFLVFGLISALLLPAITYNDYVEVNYKVAYTNSYKNSFLYEYNYSPEDLILPEESIQGQPVDWQTIAVYFYLTVASIILLFYVFTYLKIALVLGKVDHVKEGKYKVYELRNLNTPFSFFNHIVLSNLQISVAEKQMIIAHEKVHASHYHGLDNLLINLITPFLWFNPFIWLYRKEIKQNLEHIADKYALETISDKKAYQYLLLDQVLPVHSNTIHSHFFQPSIKQRIMMINKAKTSKLYMLKSTLILPVLVIFFINFQAKLVAQTTEPKDTLTMQSKTTDKSPWFITIGETKIDYYETDNYNPFKKKDYKGLTVDNYTSNHLNYNVYYTYKGDSTFSVNVPPSIKDKVKQAKGLNKRLIVKFDKTASAEYLEYVKTFLRHKVGLFIHYSDVNFNEDDVLTSIALEVIARGGVKGDFEQKGVNPIKEFYVYRDFSSNAPSPFGIRFELPEFPEKTDIGEQISTFVISPNQSFSFEATNDALSLQELGDIKTFIVNGKTIDPENTDNTTVMIDSYKYLNDETLSISGEIYKGKEFDEVFKDDKKLKIKLENKSFIIFNGKDKPAAMMLNISKDTINSFQNQRQVNSDNDNKYDTKIGKVNINYQEQQQSNGNKVLEIVDGQKVNRFFIAINQRADKAYLEFVKDYLDREHDVKVNFSKLKYDKDELLTGIKVKLKINDGFEGSYSKSGNTPIDEFYIYQNFAKDAKHVFGLGELPEEYHKDVNAKVHTSFTISPENYSANSKPSEHKALVDLSSVETYIINGKKRELKDISKLIVLPESYEFIDEQTFKVEGKELKGDDFNAFFQPNDDEFTNKKVIFFMNSKAIFSLYSKSKSEKTDSKNPE